jgi:hypothetical protein
MTTLYEKIIELKDQHPELASRTVAERLGCHPSYVRTAWQRQKKRRPKTHRQVVEQVIAEFIRDEIMDADYTKEASIMFLSGFAGFGENEERIAAELGYARHFVDEIGQRFRSSKIWTDGRVATDIFADWNEGEGLLSTVVWNMCLLVAKGRVYCAFDDKGERRWGSVENLREDRAKELKSPLPKQRRRVEPRRRLLPPPQLTTQAPSVDGPIERVLKWREGRDSRLYKSKFEPS